MDKVYISQRFKTFAIDECRGSSQLYEHLSLNIAKDDMLLELCASARRRSANTQFAFWDSSLSAFGGQTA